MAKQEIDIGVEGNDGTGDSIRESFRKVNDNFSELYAIFGQGGQIGLTSLNDTPSTYLGNEGKVVIVRPDGAGVDFYGLVSGGGDNNPNNPANTISFTIDGNQLVVESINTKLSTDPTPSVLNPLNIGSAAAYQNSTHNTLLNQNTIGSLVTSWNTTHSATSTPITADNLVITKGYGDLNYVNVSGDTMTGPLNVPPADVLSGTGTEVPQIQEVVKRSGDIMTGPLTLFDHPEPLNGAGIVNSEQDLQAVTKYYVDNTASYTSPLNLFVNLAGDDDESNSPAGKAGRNDPYAFRSIAAACAKAERIQQASAPDLGPYLQTITHSNKTINSTINAVIGYTVVSADQTDISTLLQVDAQQIIDDTILATSAQFPDTVYDEATYRSDLALILESVRLDILASNTVLKHNFLSRYAGLRYFRNPSAQLAIAPNGLLPLTVFAISFAKIRSRQLLLQNYAVGFGQWYDSLGDRFEDILETIDVDTPDPLLVESVNYYTIRINSGLNRQTDQSIPQNPDLIPGKIIRGKTSRAIGIVISYERGIDSIGTPTYDVVRMKLIIPIEFEEGEEIEFANKVNQKQITIRVESGTYDEQLPIRVPTDVSIKGDEFRRVIVRPAPGISQSPWADTWFYRDRLFDGLTIASGGDPYVVNGNTVGYFGHHYLTDPSDPSSTPLNNDQMDVFLMNDNTIMRNITCQRHGGFMMVLDPAGQILTRSPYAQTCSSFSKSQNQKAFHGGMYIDGYASNIPLTVISKNNDFSINVTAPSASGLGIRTPATPASFFRLGNRYQVNAISNYVADNGSGVASATLILAETSNEEAGFDEAVGGGTTIDIVLLGGGNKSMLANDYTQINDLGYGIVATNNALTELVSVFTYYAQIGYYSKNGSQIRSLTGNNSYGNFGIVADASDPDEAARVVTLDQNLVQPVKIYSVMQELTFTGNITGLLVNGELLLQEQIDNLNAGSGTIAYSSYDVALNTTTVFLEKVTGSFIADLPVRDEASTVVGTPTNVLNRNFGANASSVAVYVYDVTDYPVNGAEIEILHNSGLYRPYEVVTVSDTGLTIPLDQEVALCNSSNALLRRKIWRLDLTSAVVTVDSGLQEQTDFGTFGVFRAKQNFILNGVESTTLTRPSTALTFLEREDYTYRTISFENTIVDSIPVTGIQSRTTVDDNYAYINLSVNNDRATINASTIDPLWTGTLGSTAGDTHIVISRLSESDNLRVIGKIFTWDGVLHEVIDYQEEVVSGGTFGIVTISDIYAIDPNHTTGINRRVDSAIGDNIVLEAGLAAGSEGNVTVNISTARATGHDFLDIGTGGYNDTNYPDRIYGRPISLPVSEGDAIDERGFNTKAQVQERTRGRVFFSGTDQDGFFRVGRYFTVDQGTGRVTFNAALVLTNIDGIGFRRGVRVNEFSPDTGFVNARGDAVPTQTAVEGYINRRLGWDREGDFITPGDVIGSGAVRKSGDTMTGLLNMGGNIVTNVPQPTSNSDVTNKLYVDNRIEDFDSLSKLQDISFTLPANNAELIIYNSSTERWNNVSLSNLAATSDVSLTYTGGILSAQINSGAIINADVSASAAIAQSKLAMIAATTRINATGITQADRGLASFNSAEFTATNGWIAIAASGIANNKLANSSITIGSTALSLGDSVTSLAGLSNITSTTFTGNLSSTGTSNLATATITNLTVTNAINGSITGNAGTVSVTARNTSTENHFITFTQNSSGAQNQFTDTGLRYVPTDDVFTIGGTITLRGSNGGITVSGNILPGTNNPTDSGQNIGASTNRWNTVWASTFNGTATTALYADLAENYLGDAHYEPGTVLVFGGDEEVTLCNIKGSRRIAGVVSTNPAYLMNSALEGEHVIAVALQGRVPCKVLGRVEKGDLLVTSAISGYAIVDNDPKVGSVIGKAVSNKLDDGKGWAEIVVGRV